MNYIKTFFRQLFCQHRWDVKNASQLMSIVWCQKCGKEKVATVNP